MHKHEHQQFRANECQWAIAIPCVLSIQRFSQAASARRRVAVRAAVAAEAPSAAPAAAAPGTQVSRGALISSGRLTKGVLRK